MSITYRQLIALINGAESVALFFIALHNGDGVVLAVAIGCGLAAASVPHAYFTVDPSVRRVTRRQEVLS